MNNKNDQAKAKEIWVPCKFIANNGTVETYHGYEVSNLGRVRSLNYNLAGTPKVMKHIALVQFHRTYYKISLRKNKKLYQRSVHRLILSSFNLKGYFKGAVVDHIDSNPSNNSLSNLHWVTQQENISTPHRKALLSKVMANHPSISKRVRVTFLCDRHIEMFMSASEVERVLGLPKCIVPNCIRRHNGYYKKQNVLFEYV